MVADPEVKVVMRSDEDEYLVLACDGVWDVISNEAMATFVGNFMAKYQNSTGVS